jgi:hypothetical protein
LPHREPFRTYATKSAGSDLADPLHCAVAPDAAPDVMWRSGAHPGVGGVGDVPCSGDLLLGALAACQEITLRMVVVLNTLRNGVPVESTFDLATTN